MTAKALSAGVRNTNVPESVVIVPLCLPNIVTETFGRGLSSSSTTLPVSIADFFWENDVMQTNKKAGKKMIFNKCCLICSGLQLGIFCINQPADGFFRIL